MDVKNTKWESNPNVRDHRLYRCVREHTVRELPYSVVVLDGRPVRLVSVVVVNVRERGLVDVAGNGDLVEVHT